MMIEQGSIQRFSQPEKGRHWGEKEARKKKKETDAFLYEYQRVVFKKEKKKTKKARRPSRKKTPKRGKPSTKRGREDNKRDHGRA